MESSAITGPYINRQTILSPATGTWENWRVDEPYVFQRNDGKWILVYMGDQGDYLSGEYYYEQIGYAIADDLLGPYVKYSENPVLRWGPSGSFDAGTIADPWVVEFQGSYYIGYTVSPTIYSPWQTAYAITTDWINFTKHGITLPLTSPPAWDSNNAFRGAVTRIGNTYVFAYTGDTYQMGIATQDVHQTPPMPYSSMDVFPFHDDFNDDSFDTSKWSFAVGDATQVDESSGLLTLTALDNYVKIYGSTNVGMDHMAEAYAQHPDAGTINLISEVGLAGSTFDNTVRIADYFHSTGTGTQYWEKQTKTELTTPPDPWDFMAQEADANWHTLRTYRLSPNTAAFQIDNTPVETTISTTDVPIVDLPAFLMSYANVSGVQNRLIVDWIRIRKWCGADAVTEVRDVQYPTAVTVTSFNAHPGGGKIHLEWQTAIELDLLGFNLYRSTSLAGDREQLNLNVIQAAVPGDYQGADYDYMDTQVQPGTSYYYWLEAVPVAGPRQLLGPVEATLMHENYLPLITQRYVNILLD
jgi:hypothetical protein